MKLQTINEFINDFDKNYTFGIIKDNSVKYTRYYLYDYPKNFRIPNNFPQFWEGDKISKSPLTHAKRMLKEIGVVNLEIVNGRKRKTITL